MCTTDIPALVSRSPACEELTSVISVDIIDNDISILISYTHHILYATFNRCMNEGSFIVAI